MIDVRVSQVLKLLFNYALNYLACVIIYCRCLISFRTVWMNDERCFDAVISRLNFLLINVCDGIKRKQSLINARINWKSICIIVNVCHWHCDIQPSNASNIPQIHWANVKLEISLYINGLERNTLCNSFKWNIFPSCNCIFSFR